MKSLKIVKVLLFLVCAYCLCAFQFAVDKTIDNKNDTLQLKIPANFPKPFYKITITKNGFALGKELFYEPRLSASSLVACSNCHRASGAFGDLNNAVSAGIEGRKGNRNTPPLFNLIWQKNYMWDGRVNEMKTVPINALTNHAEMGSTVADAIKKLKVLPEYPLLFQRAFGSSEPTEDRMLEALMQFTAMMVSANSKYDKVMRKESTVFFDEKEEAGYVLFKQKCSTCHTEPLFTDGSFRNNGLETKSIDIGRDSLTHDTGDIGKFRVPSLRNVEITSPYMHDGRFYSLKDVLKHYAEGMQPHQNLDPVFNNSNKRKGIPISSQEQAKIIAFLKTLTDVDFINDKRFNRH